MKVKRTRGLRLGDLPRGSVFRNPGLGDAYFLVGEKGDFDVVVIDLVNGAIDEWDSDTKVEAIPGSFVEAVEEG